MRKRSNSSADTANRQFPQIGKAPAGMPGYGKGSGMR
jgi:hypothetical protein